ncbi:MAG: ATP-dependent metallopeptidase FtsH/Yme1/Tma family protein [Bdellovibrionales bacterium]|nr:ATP-dependent metallopeptidase FtsH/Yme1/Tma family protein [Bdellovibrionales bacterium]
MKASRTMAFWALAVIVAVIGVQIFQQNKQAQIADFDYPKFRKALEDQKLESITFRDNGTGGEIGEIIGKVKAPYIEEMGGKEFTIVGNIGDQGARLLEQNSITPKYESSHENSFLMMILINWLPLLLVFGIFLFLMRQIQVGGGKAMSFGKSKAKLLTENKNKVTFKDVAGVNEAKEELKEVVDFLKDAKKYTRLGGKIPKGVLLVGPPGTGKTLLARAVAGEAGVPFFTISGSDFVEMFVGVGASRVRDLFEQGKRNAPCLIFIDEIDAVGRHRGAGMGGGHDEREQTLNQMLVEMDGFESNDGVIIIAATNRPDVLDPALLRPGRFDRRVVVNKPDLNGREKILNVHAKKVPLASDVNLKKVAQGTPGFSGADLANLVNESALNAARNDRSKVAMMDFDFAKDKVIMGSERKSMAISDEDKKITAYHEAGHALVGKKLKGTDPLHKVTIIPRGMALGLTQFLPEQDRLNMSKKSAENMIAMLFGGRVAEEIIFEDYTTGAGNDIERATSVARKMVCEWGMSEKLGPLAFEKNEGPVFLGMQSQNKKEYSDTKANEIDTEVHRIIMDGYNKAKRILNDNLKELHAVSEALLEFETIDGEDVDLILKGGSVQDVRERHSKMNADMAKEQKKAKEEMDKKVKEEEKEETSSIADSMGDPGTA